MDRIKQIVSKIWRWTWIATITFFIITIGMVVVLRFVPTPVTPLMLIRCGEQLADGRSLRLNKDWVSFSNISPNMVQAAVAAEDSSFPEHFGFDFEAIQKAMRHNERSKKIRGASTISQQTAKNVFLWPSRSYVRKGLEVYLTFLIEVMWTKERIMEVYLNIVEMGDGVYGVEAAAQKYYHKPAAKLSRAEAAMLAAILPRPLKRYPDRPTGFLQNRQARILRLMLKLGPVKL